MCFPDTHFFYTLTTSSYNNSASIRQYITINPARSDKGLQYTLSQFVLNNMAHYWRGHNVVQRTMD